MSTAESDYEVDWYRVPLPPGRLQELNRRSNWRGLLQSAAHLGIMTATGSAAVYASLHQAWLWLIPLLYLHGAVCAFAINAVHELVHGTVFRWKWLNDVFVHVFAFVGWINHRGFWTSHSEHHKYTLHDPHDREVVVPVRYRFRDFAKNAVVNPRAMWWTLGHTLRTARGQLQGDWEHHLLDGQERRHAIFRWARILLLGHAAIAAVSLYHGLWIVPVVVSMTPAYGRLIFSLINSTQHVGLPDHVRDFRLNCRSIDINPVFRLLYWHMNYHIEHHMYAAVPCYRLRALHREIAHALPTPPKGLVATWYHIIAVLYRQREEPGYVYVAPLPEQAQAPADSATAAAPTEPVPAEPAPRAADEEPVEPASTAKVWQCAVCAFVYDEAKGLPDEGIAPGTPWDAIDDDWRCPDCGVGKADFEMVEITRAA